jgi:pSer/pThr/pTyr-binding forkhead associated (FHA) protein
MQARLVHVENGEAVARKLLLEEVVVIGRDASSDLVVSHPGVSRHHATVEHVDDGHTLRDLGSTNGTRLNGNYLSEPALLCPGDIIRLGEDVTLVYELEEKKRAALDWDEIPQAPLLSKGSWPRLRLPSRVPRAALVVGLTGLMGVAAAWWLGLL